MSTPTLASASREHFVHLDVPMWCWLVLAAAIVAMLAVDLFRHRDDHEPSPREALVESAIWIGCGLGFSVFVALQFGGAAFGEYISGYLIEKSLSVDNVFVWSMLFTSMAIPLKYQHRVLFWGIFGALALRAGFVILGSALITQFWWVLLIFGVFLIYTGVKIFRHRNADEVQEATHGLGLLRKIMPVTEELDGHKFFTRQNARRAATPLLAALVVIEVTDIIFAVDSVPAILAVSHESFIVLSSNAFAILGLRAMYFLLANAKEKFFYLSHALGGILVFVGAKMTISHWVHVNTYLSLGVIVLMLAVAILFSVRRNAAQPVMEGSPT
ncbi:MAG: putative TerC family integral rane protein [Ilumatobacteraceae bacterium]|nr:putative TerC family integral rane protein [Ilumatobacteraceae bacterium]